MELLFEFLTREAGWEPATVVQIMWRDYRRGLTHHMFRVSYSLHKPIQTRREPRDGAKPDSHEQAEPILFWIGQRGSRPLAAVGPPAEISGAPLDTPSSGHHALLRETRIRLPLKSP